MIFRHTPKQLEACAELGMQGFNAVALDGWTTAAIRAVECTDNDEAVRFYRVPHRLQVLSALQLGRQEMKHCPVVPDIVCLLGQLER